MPRRRPENRTIEVILLEQHKDLWEKYEIVRVKPIFARNVLLPQWLVVLATPDMMHKYQVQMQKAKESLAKKVSKLEELFAKMQQEWGVSLSKKVNEKEVMYDKVDAQDIAKLIEDTYGIKLDVRNIKLKKPIDKAGDYKVPYKYKELERNLLITIKWEQDKKTAEKAKELHDAEEAKEEEAK